MSRARVAVLASGSGTNLQALLDAAKEPRYPADIVVVLSNAPTAFALERARRAGVPTEVLEHRAFPSREAFDGAMVARLQEHRVEWVCLAGFMRLITPVFLRAFPGRVLNVHPALLPAFPGMHGVQQALECGVKVAGCTVHFVDAGTDTGPIIAQAAVPVLDSDDEASLSARVLEQEHRLYVESLARVIRGEVRVEGRHVVAARPA
ncbi:MAG: phosphoribosylglycinamide formyltransferase [Myxococcaceae bacterium]|nr:phosphoribosylglycinamide formyltransferase [Myxococcaceae bacterium]